MGAGSINNPEKKYHIECKVMEIGMAKNIVDVMKLYDIFFKQRDKIMYMKDGEEISKFLAFIGAAKSVMRFEEIRVERHMNNKVNRLVNCETANLNKTISAAVKQTRDIEYIRDTVGLSSLKEGLYQVAKIRLEHQDMNLKDIGALLDPPVGKSGVNHRLRKISELADEIRVSRGDA